LPHPDYSPNLDQEVERPFLEDYNPIVITAFQDYERIRYDPDTAPNVDTNLDGITFVGDFGADYTASGWPGAHAHATPTAWNQIDPPRKYPVAKYDPANPDTIRTRYWHEWMNFRVKYVDAFIEQLVDAVVLAGWPADRIFTHQTGGSSSFAFDRAHGTSDPNSPLYNAEWLDDWVHIEVSKGMCGTSRYTPFGVTDGPYEFDNMARRDDSWGSPEFNPFITGGPIPATFAQVTTVLNKAWDTRAHILWPHAWGDSGAPVFDVSKAWGRDRLPSSPTFNSFPEWLPNHLSASGNTLTATTSDAYIENTTLSLDSTQYGYLVLTEFWSVPNQSAVQADLKVQLQKGGVWEAPITGTNCLRSDTMGVRDFVVALAGGGSGTITGMRIWPAPLVNSSVLFQTLLLAQPNDFTRALKYFVDSKVTPDVSRPAALPDYVLPTPPLKSTKLSQELSALYNSAHLAVYGVDPLTPDQFGDFAPTNAQGRVNFDRSTAIVCGGVSMEGIVAPAPTYLGLRKTGKFRRLRIPNWNDVCLSFFVGLQDGTPSTVDGVRFRILLREYPSREVFTLSDLEWRKHAWSPKQIVNLAQWKDKVVDIAFETHGVDETTGDRAAWGDPTIQRVKYFESIGADDGRVIESSETSDMGGTGVFANDASGSGLQVGDTGSGLDQQIKSILSFDTAALTNMATVTGASVRFVRGGTSGVFVNSPGSNGFGSLVIDIAKGSFNNSPSLQHQDFEWFFSGTVLNGAGTIVLPTMSVSIPTAPAAAWATSTLGSSANTYVKTTGRTQLRLRFTLDDNDNGLLDYLGFFGGEAAAGLRPVLEVTYTL
jgi:hypothetical protein